MAAVQEPVEPLKNLLLLLKNSDYDDIRNNHDITNVLYSFGFPLLHVMLNQPEHWSYVSVPFLLKIIETEGYQLNINDAEEVTRFWSLSQTVSFCKNVLRDLARVAIRKQAEDSRAAGNVDAAILYYSKAIKSDPDYLEAYFQLADLLHQQGDFIEADRISREALTLQASQHSS